MDHFVVNHKATADTSTQRLALRRLDPDDESRLARPLLEIMSEHKLDFHSTFRRLAYFRPSWVQSTGETNGSAPDGVLDEYISSLLALTPESETMDKAKATDDWKNWLERYASRIHSERSEWGGADFDAEREKACRAANPRFVLRQWVLEEVIKKVEENADTGKRVLRKVLQVSFRRIAPNIWSSSDETLAQMACNPFEPWGAEDDPRPQESLDPEILEERRYCGIGERKMLGFQCSCSS